MSSFCSPTFVWHEIVDSFFVLFHFSIKTMRNCIFYYAFFKIFSGLLCRLWRIKVMLKKVVNDKNVQRKSRNFSASWNGNTTCSFDLYINVWKIIIIQEVMPYIALVWTSDKPFSHLTFPDFIFKGLPFLIFQWYKKFWLRLRCCSYLTIFQFSF